MAYCTKRARWQGTHRNGPFDILPSVLSHWTTINAFVDPSHTISELEGSLQMTKFNPLTLLGRKS